MLSPLEKVDRVGAILYDVIDVGTKKKRIINLPFYIRTKSIKEKRKRK